MDAEIIVSSLIEKLNENKSTMVRPMFGNPVQKAIEDLKLLKDHLKKDHPMNDLETAQLLKAVYSAEDAIDNLLSRKRMGLESKREKSVREGGGILVEKEELQKEAKELRREKEELKREKEELKSEENELRRGVEESQRKEKELRREKEELMRKEKELRRRREEVEREKEKWKRETEEEELRLREIKKGQRENEELQKANEKLQKENEEFQRMNEEMLPENEALQRENEKLLREKEEFLSDMEKLQDELRGKKENLQRKEENLQMKRQEKEKGQRETEEEESHVNKELRRVKNRLREVSLVKQLPVNYFRLRYSRKSEDLKREEKALEIRREELQREKEKWQRVNEELQKEGEELRRENEDSERDNEKLRRDMEKFQKNKEELKREKEELERKEKELRGREEESRRKGKELRGMKEELHSKEEELRKEREELETKKEKRQRENEKKEFLLTELLRENKERQRENEEFQKENEEFRRESEESLKENGDLQTENDKLQRENEELLRDIEKLQKDTEELQRSDEKFSGKREPLLKAREEFPRRRMNILDRKVFKWPSRFFKPLCYQIVFLREMKKLKEIQALCCQKDVKSDVANNNASGQHSQRRQRWGKISDFCLEENRVVGFQEQIKDLVGKLISDIGQLQQDHHHESPQPQVIKVIGVGGSGKTTLIRTVYNTLDVKLHFSIRAWVHVSSITKGRDLWIELVKQIDPARLVQETLSEEEMVSRLTKLLKDTRYLIVIDQDVEKPHHWQALTNALCSSSNKGKIIIITQDENSAGQGENNPRQVYHLTVKSAELKNDESWKLFSEKAGIAENDDPTVKLSLEELKKKILSLCNGSPLRLVMLGGLFSANKNRSHDEWLKAIRPASNSDEDILDLCYQDLPSQVKPCLFYMVLFPRGFEIPVRRLIHLWCSEGFVTSLVRNSQEVAAEDLAEMYFEELVIRNMIQIRWRLDGTPKACRLPSALYNAFCRKAMGFGFLYNQLNSSLKSTKQFGCVRRFATYLGTNNEFSSNPFSHVKHLRTYIAFDTRIQGITSIETSMLLKRFMGKRRFRLLKILDLEGVYKPRNIDIVVQQFLNLSYLGLRSTFIDYLPGSVGELQHLETLDLKHTRIHNIPNQVWHARSLKHLYLSWINGVADFNSVPTQLPKLHTLRGLYWKPGSSYVIESLGNSVSLRKLGLAYNSSSQRSISEQVSKLTSLQSLKLRYINDGGESEARHLKLKKMHEHQKLQDLYLRGQLNPDFVIDAQFFPPNLKTLTLSMSRLVADPMQVLGQLPHLNILRLFADSYIGKEMRCLQGGFPKLRVLKLWKLPVEHWTLEKEAMPCLQELEVRSCSTLKFIEGSEHLTSLNEIVLTNMPSNLLRSLPTKNGYVKRVKL